MLCDLKPGNLEKHRWNKTARDLDRAFDGAKLTPQQRCLLTAAREESWAKSLILKQRSQGDGEPIPFKLPVSALAVIHGFNRSALSRSVSELVQMRIFNRAGDRLLINKEYRDWIDAKTGNPLLSRVQLYYISRASEIETPTPEQVRPYLETVAPAQHQTVAPAQQLDRPPVAQAQQDPPRSVAQAQQHDAPPYRNGREERVLRERNTRPLCIPPNGEQPKDTTEFSTPQGKSGDDHVLVPQGKTEPAQPAPAPVSQPDPQPVPGVAAVRPVGDQPKPAPVETEEDREEALRLRRLSEFKATAQWLRRAYPEVDENFGGNLMGWLATYDLGSIRDAIVKSMENCKAGGRARYVNATLREWRLEESKPKPKPADVPKPKPPEPKYYVPEPGTPPVRFITKAQREELERKNRWRYGRVI